MSRRVELFIQIGDALGIPIVGIGALRDALPELKQYPDLRSVSMLEAVAKYVESGFDRSNLPPIPQRKQQRVGKLSLQKVLQLHAEGSSYGEIAKLAGVSRQYVHKAVKKFKE